MYGISTVYIWLIFMVNVGLNLPYMDDIGMEWNSALIVHQQSTGDAS